jgi:hypothetical protein
MMQTQEADERVSTRSRFAVTPLSILAALDTLAFE